MIHTEQKKIALIQKTSLQLFVIGGLLGSLIDTSYRSATEKQFVFEGFFSNLFGERFILPFLPVYGFGIVLIYLLHPFAQKQRWYARFLLFSVSLSALEFFSGIFVSLTLKTRLWDYSSSAFNLYGYIDLLHAFYWGVLGMAAYYFFTRYPPEKWFPLQEKRITDFLRREKS